jgi:hypothetical protein
MISRRESFLAGASMLTSAWVGFPAFAQKEQKEAPFEFARKNVGKRACELCDDRGQVQKASGGSTAVFAAQGMPGATWLQEGYVLCPDCAGESKEYRFAVSQIKDGMLPWVELAKKRVEKLKADGKFESIKKRAKEAQPEASMFPRFNLFGQKGSGGVSKAKRGTYLLASLRAHYRTATLTRGVVRAVIVRWGGPDATKKAAGLVDASSQFIDGNLLLTCRDLLSFAASTLDVKYREPCGFPPKYNSIPTLRNKTLPENFAFHYLG